MKSVNDRMAKGSARYGKTLGASKGSKPSEPASVRVRPRKDGVKLTVKKKF